MTLPETILICVGVLLAIVAIAVVLLRQHHFAIEQLREQHDRDMNDLMVEAYLLGHRNAWLFAVRQPKPRGRGLSALFPKTKIRLT